jgi:hypothetical protein
LFDVLLGFLRCHIGGKGCFDIREYILDRRNWFQEKGIFADGIPAGNTITRIISSIDTLCVGYSGDLLCQNSYRGET